MINVFKRELNVARQLKPDLPVEDFYLIIDEVLSQCVRGGRVDLDEFEQLLKSYIAKHEARGADSQAGRGVRSRSSSKMLRRDWWTTL
jgi:hypothetical protein